MPGLLINRGMNIQLFLEIIVLHITFVHCLKIPYTLFILFISFDPVGKPIRTYVKNISFLITWLIICPRASPGGL